MQLHPLLSDPHAVLVSRTPVSEPVRGEDFRRAAQQVMAALQVSLAGEGVVIKPNLTSAERFADPDSGITTHPAFVRGMLEYLREHGARRDGMTIAEDPRNSDDDEPRHWRGTGYLELASEMGVSLHCPTRRTCVRRTVPQPLVHRERLVSRPAVDPGTVLINVPKLKTHNLAITTLCLKNLMGLDYGPERHYCSQAWRDIPAGQHDDRPRTEWLDRALHERWQEGLARRLADLFQVLRPQLNVVEGVVGREGTGFQQGSNRPLGLVIAGTNAVAVDSVASYLMGFDPQQLIYLRVAAQAGLGTHDLAQLRLYTVEEGQVVPCTNLEALRARPRFRVIRGIAREEAEYDYA